MRRLLLTSTILWVFLLNVIPLTDIKAVEVTKTLLLDKSENTVKMEDIIHIPGIGLGLYHSSDSIMWLDNPDLTYFSLLEPIKARSFVITNNNMYAASGDSIYRVASDSLPRKFIGRFDNEQFTLSRASEESFFVSTADNEFSCVYEVFPATEECEPVIGVEGPIYKIENNGVVTMLWAGDTIYTLEDDFSMRPVYWNPDISDAVMSGMGLMVATPQGLTWMPSPTVETTIVNEPVVGVWWDPSDTLYYLTESRDLISVKGLLEQYRESAVR